MEHWRTMTRVVALLYCLFPIWAWRCDTLLCITEPLSLRLRHRGVELKAKSITVQAGSTLTVICDGSCVGFNNDPLLRWYGDDGHWIAHEGLHNRIHVEQSTVSRRYQKLYLRNIRSEDAGVYTCRGWLGPKVRFDTESVRVIVESPSTTPPHLQTTSTTAHTTRAPTEGTTTEHSNPHEVVACESTQFQCASGPCIARTYVCDNFPDCGDNDDSDEHNCGGITCREDETACNDDSRCVLPTEICDGNRDCDDGSDEDATICRQK